MAFDSAHSPTPECGHSVLNSHPAGCNVGTSSCRRSEWRYPGLQGRIHMKSLQQTQTVSF